MSRVLETTESVQQLAQRKGIQILNTSCVNERAVAELVVALTTGPAQRLRPISIDLGSGEVVRKDKSSGLILHKRTVGMIGMSNIGKPIENFQGRLRE